MRPGEHRKLDLKHELARLLLQVKQLQASVYEKVEYPFYVVKNLFKHTKACYKGLAKNESKLFSLFRLTNKIVAKRQLLAIHCRGAH